MIGDKPGDTGPGQQVLPNSQCLRDSRCLRGIGRGNLWAELLVTIEHRTTVGVAREPAAYGA